MARNLNFRQIEAFRAVMITGTTTAAAQMLHTTQPSVSRLLAQMHSATQLKLFDVQKARLRPTKEARQLFEIIQRHFLGLERIEQSVATMRKSGTKSLRIGSTPALGLSVMPKVISAFSQLHPEVQINLQTTSGHDLREGLAYGSYDVVLATTSAGAWHQTARVIHRANAVCVMHPTHPLAARKTIHARELAHEMLLTLNADDELSVGFQRLMRQYQIDEVSRLETTYSSTICMMAAQGIGIGLVNPYIASIFSRDLRIAPLVPRLPVQVVMAYSEQFAPSVIAETFVRCLRDHLTDYQRDGLSA